jgi:hypothetical protein
MNNLRLEKEPSNVKKNNKRFSKLTSFIILGTLVAALIGIGTLAFSESSTTVVASQQAQPTPRGDKNYKATKNIIADSETGRLRKPNETELKDLVDTLKIMTKRPDENLKSDLLSNGGEVVDVEDGYAGVMLARPNADGTSETRCVFTFEEAAAFLGLEEDNSTK